MYPRSLFYVFGQGINLYILFYGLGFVPAVVLGVAMARERGLALAPIVDAAWISILAALLGGPVLVVLVFRRLVPSLPLNWSFAQVLAVVAALFAYNQVRRIDRARFGPRLDVLFPAAALYIACARVGCFTAGCCHGVPAWDLPWAVTFGDPASHSIYIGIPLHPTQLYEAGGCLGIAGLLYALRKRPFWYGRLAWAFMIAYGALRFSVEFWRGDIRPMVGALSLAQAVCLGTVALGGAVLVYLSRLGTTD